MISDIHGDATMWGYSASKPYDPFGTVIGTTGLPSTIGYQSEYSDPTTGDVNMGARWYNPSTATFRTRDTYAGKLQTPFSLNRYAYGLNNPTRYWDPTGRFSIEEVMSGGMSAGFGFDQRNSQILWIGGLLGGDLSSLV